MKEIIRLRPHISKESIVASPEIKSVVKETSKKVDEIVPKQEVKTVEVSKRVDIERQIK
jgi:DNA-directed RNA polymerase beta' subunit